MAARLTPDQKVGSSNLSGLIFGVANMVQRGGVNCRAMASTPPSPHAHHLSVRQKQQRESGTHLVGCLSEKQALRFKIAI